MRKLLIFYLLVSFFYNTIPLAKDRTEDLPEIYRKWLEEEVVYIITPLEKKVFQALNTNRERGTFIEAFWKQRDPSPGSEENEFKTEHYQRINYANRYFSRNAPRPGWRTDRGRVYIILGEPRDRVTYAGSQSVYPSEVWWYQPDSKTGLPTGFSLVFFQERGLGDFRLYSPLKDGPQRLLAAYDGDPMDYLAAYKELAESEPSLAQVSLSLIPNEERVDIGRPSMVSDVLIQKIEETPQRLLKDRYAQKFLEYKDIVELEYSTNYIDSDSLIHISKDSGGVHFVHYVIEIPRLSVRSYENKYYFSLNLNGTISNQDGKIIYQYEKPISYQFSADRIEEFDLKPFNLHDMFPLIPGDFKLSVLVRNETSKEFTSLEANLTIPEDDVMIRMSSLLLGYKAILEELKEKRLKPFHLGAYLISCQPNQTFLNTDSLVVAFQIHGLKPEFADKASLKFTVFKNDEEFRTLTKNIREYPDDINFLQEFPLNEFPPSYYVIQVSLMENKKEFISQKQEFAITALSSIPRPWVHSRILPEIESPYYSYILGIQFTNCGFHEKARAYLEKAVEKQPGSADYSLALAQVYRTLKEYEEAKSILLPFAAQPEPAYEFLFLLGQTHLNLGEFDRAIIILDKAISLYGLNINVLNMIGESYLRINNPEEALKAWEKSLEINPNQTEIINKVNSLKK
jgi:GWxTD domain-containing protein